MVLSARMSSKRAAATVTLPVDERNAHMIRKNLHNQEGIKITRKILNNAVLIGSDSSDSDSSKEEIPS